MATIKITSTDMGIYIFINRPNTTTKKLQVRLEKEIKKENKSLVKWGGDNIKKLKRDKGDC